MATKDAQGNLHDDNNGRFTNKQGGYQESVNDRIKWAKENGVEIPLNADGSVDDLKLQEIERNYQDNVESRKNQENIFLPDEILPRSIGARWANYEILMADGTVARFQEGTKLHHKEIIAGRGNKRKIDEIDRLVSKYGGKTDDWVKVKAFGTIVKPNGEIEEIEIHWYEEPTVGKVKLKEKI